MATTPREIRVRVIPYSPHREYVSALESSPLAAGFRERGADRLMRAIAEHALEDAIADAEAIRSNRDLLESELRAARLRLNETETLLSAARHVGRDQLVEIGELHAALTEQRANDPTFTARVEAAVEERVNALVQRIDVYQCELQGMHAEQAESETLMRKVLTACTAGMPTGAARLELIERIRAYVDLRGGA